MCKYYFIYICLGGICGSETHWFGKGKYTTSTAALDMSSLQTNIPTDPPAVLTLSHGL